MNFENLPIGARFTFFGNAYTKLGLSMAKTHDGTGHVFQYEAEVESDAPPQPPMRPGPRSETDTERTLRLMAAGVS